MKIQPAIHQVTSLSSLGPSLAVWYEYVVSDSPKTKEILSESNSWVDVRDTDLGHGISLEKNAAGGQRIITASGEHHVILIYSVISGIEGYIWQEWSMFTHPTSEYP